MSKCHPKSECQHYFGNKSHEILWNKYCDGQQEHSTYQVAFLSQTLIMNPWDNLIDAVPELFGACSQQFVWDGSLECASK